MIEKIKLSIKMTKYTLNRKSTLLSITLFFVLGIVMLCVRLYAPNDSGAAAMGCYYFALTSMFVGQMIFLTTVSKLVQCSPKKRFLQVECVPFICLVCNVIMFSLYFGISFIGMKISPAFKMAPDMVNIIKTDMIILGVFSLTLEIYAGIVYKIFWIASACILAILTPMLLASLNAVNMHLDFIPDCSFGVCAIIGYVLVFLGYPIARGAAALSYKKDISPASYKAALQREK